MKGLMTLALTLTLGASAQARSTVSARSPASARNIVIVHGAFAEGSGWDGVARILTDRGYNVTIINNSTQSLAADVAATKSALASQNGPVILVGHSYGGEVITQAGNDQKVKALVYVAAYVPNEGESLQTLLGLTKKMYPSMPAPPIIPAAKVGFLMVKPEKFPEFFAADVTMVDSTRVQSMAANQLPLGAQTLDEKITTVAWKVKPSYYIVSSQDRMIPPAFEKWMAKRAGATQFQIKASHAVYISQPDKVAEVIDKAASR